MSALFTQCLGDTVQTGTGNVDPARKFKCTTAARAEHFVHDIMDLLYYTWQVEGLSQYLVW